MSSSIRPRLSIDIAGEPYQFAQPFTMTFMQTATTPAVYQVEVPAASTAVVWSSTFPTDEIDFIALMSDADVTLTVEVDGGGADDFTLFLRGGGFPVSLCGVPTGSEITSISAANANTTSSAFVSVCVAKESA